MADRLFHAPSHRGRAGRIGHVFLHEIRLVIPPTLFFFVGFNLILFTKRLFLSDYLIAYAGFLVATTSALIVGKVVRSPTRCLFCTASITSRWPSRTCSRPSYTRWSS